MLTVTIERTVDIAAPTDRVWQVISDVRGWPEWTESVDAVDFDDPPLRVGSRVKIKQPRLPPAVWTVTELTPGRSFTWDARGPGFTTTASHELTETPTGTRARLSIDQRGLTAPLMRLVGDRLTARYVQMEADGLKRRSEA